MDELQALSTFRADAARVGADDPVHERTMGAIRALIEQEAAGSARRRHRFMPRLPRGRVAAVLVAAAALAAALAVLPTHRSTPSLVGQALAAIGSGNVLHVIGEQSTGRELVDLASGKATPILQQQEIWFDESRGLRRDISRIDGRIVDDTFQSPAGGWTPHGIVYDCAWIAAHPKEATKARVSCNASGDNGTTPRTIPRPKPTLDPGLSGFVDGYRSALAAGSAREGGSGTFDGMSVDWLIFTTSYGPERVALDAATHKPVVIQGPEPNQELRITEIETTDDGAGAFAKPSSDETPVGPNLGRADDDQSISLDASAIAGAYPGAVWAGMSVDGLPLASVTVQHLTAHYPAGRPPKSGTGIQLHYGSLTANGRPDFTKPYVTISEAPSPDLATAYMWGFQRGSVPAPGMLSTTGFSGASVGFMVANGSLVTIQASSRLLLLSGARALNSVP